jgi:hypothetical protein
MMETWAVIGRILLDKAFHEDLFAASYRKQFFEDLNDSRKILRIDNHLNLGRWEIMVIHRSVTEMNDNTGDPILFDSPADDQAVLAVRAGWTATPPAFPKDRVLCAVVGLSAMDFTFRNNLYSHTDPDPQKTGPLNDFLTHPGNPGAESPTFELKKLQLINLNRFMRYTDPQGITMVDLLRDYHIQRWVQPGDYPCDGGYTETGRDRGGVASYVFFAQQALVRLVLREPPETGSELLQKHGVRFPG